MHRPSIFALHLVNGEHYSGAERVQDLLARQLPQFGCEVGFACVKPQKFPNARETKTAPLVEMPMRGPVRFPHREAARRTVRRRRLRSDSCPHAANGAGRPVGRPHGRRAVRLSRTQPSRPRFDAPTAQLDQRRRRMGSRPRRRSADRRFAERARLHDRPRHPGRTNRLRAERRASFERSGRAPPADRHLDAWGRRTLSAAQRHRSAARSIWPCCGRGT